MANRQPDILPLMPHGLVRAWRWCADVWEATATADMALVVLLCVLSVRLVAEDHAKPAAVVQTPARDELTASTNSRDLIAITARLARAKYGELYLGEDNQTVRTPPSNDGNGG